MAQQCLVAAHHAQLAQRAHAQQEDHQAVQHLHGAVEHDRRVDAHHHGAAHQVGERAVAEGLGPEGHHGRQQHQAQAVADDAEEPARGELGRDVGQARRAQRERGEARQRGHLGQEDQPRDHHGLGDQLVQLVGEVDRHADGQQREERPVDDLAQDQHRGDQRGGAEDWLEGVGELGEDPQAGEEGDEHAQRDGALEDGAHRREVFVVGQVGVDAAARRVDADHQQHREHAEHDDEVALLRPVLGEVVGVAPLLPAQLLADGRGVDAVPEVGAPDRRDVALQHLADGLVAGFGDQAFVAASLLAQAGDVGLKAQHPGLALVGCGTGLSRGGQHLVDLQDDLFAHLQLHGLVAGGAPQRAGAADGRDVLLDHGAVLAQCRLSGLEELADLAPALLHAIEGEHRGRRIARRFGALDLLLDALAQVGDGGGCGFDVFARLEAAVALHQPPLGALRLDADVGHRDGPGRLFLGDLAVGVPRPVSCLLREGRRCSGGQRCQRDEQRRPPPADSSRLLRVIAAGS